MLYLILEIGLRFIITKIPVSSRAVEADSGDAVAGDDGDTFLGVATFVPRIGSLVGAPTFHLLHDV